MEIFNHITRLIEKKEPKMNIRLIIKARYKIGVKQSYQYISNYEKEKRAIGNKNPFLEVTDQEIIERYMKANGVQATAKALMVTKYRVASVVEKEIKAGNEELKKKRESITKSISNHSQAKSMAMKFLRAYKGQEFTRNKLLDIACKNEACNYFSVQDVKKMAVDAGIIIKTNKREKE